MNCIPFTVKVIRVGVSPEARLRLPEMVTTEFGVEADRSLEAEAWSGGKKTETAPVFVEPPCQE